MPITKVLRTTIGGYEVWNFASADMALYFRYAEDHSPECTASGYVRVAFTALTPFVPGTLRVNLGGVRQPAGYVTAQNGALGTFTLAVAPGASDMPLDIDYIRA